MSLSGFGIRVMVSLWNKFGSIPFSSIFWDILRWLWISTLAWKIPWTEEPGRLQSMGDATERLHFHFSLSCIGEGDGNPLQCFCLENPRDGGAWWAAVCGVAESNMTEAT